MKNEFSGKFAAANVSLGYMTDEFDRLHRTLSQTHAPLLSNSENFSAAENKVAEMVPATSANDRALSKCEKFLEPPVGFRDCDNILFEESLDVVLNVNDKIGRATQDLKDLSAVCSMNGNIKTNIQDEVAALQTHIDDIVTGQISCEPNIENNYTAENREVISEPHPMHDLNSHNQDIFRSKRVLFVCDYLLSARVFDQGKFGKTFQVKTLQIGSYAKLVREENMRRLLAFGNIDAYVLALGTNDLRDHYDQHVERNVMTVVDFLATRTSAKIVVSMPPRTRDSCHMGDRIQTFRSRTIEYVDKCREDENFKGRVVLQDSSLFDRNNVLQAPFEVFSDNIHLKSRGTRILLGQIKHSLRQVFGMLPKNRTTRTEQLADF